MKETSRCIVGKHEFLVNWKERRTHAHLMRCTLVRPTFVVLAGSACSAEAALCPGEFKRDLLPHYRRRALLGHSSIKQREGQQVQPNLHSCIGNGSELPPLAVFYNLPESRARGKPSPSRKNFNYSVPS